MPHHPPPYPFERPESLAGMLREQGIAPDELDDLLPVARRLAEWQIPPATPAESQRLLMRLAPQVLGQSAVRQAAYARSQRPGAGVSWLLATARAQVSLFGLAFWLVSALVTLLGAVATLSNVSATLSTQQLLLRASGPLLAYLGTVIAFRGTSEHVLELELACLPSPAQVTVARLVIVLGYDVGLGLALGLALWVGGVGQALALTLSWLMPLLLVAGLALLLSLRLSVQAAAAVAYGSWLTFLAFGVIANFQALPLMSMIDILAGGVGVALLIVALLRLQTDMPRLLPHA